MKSNQPAESMDRLEPDAITRITAALKDAIEAICDTFGRVVRMVIRNFRKLAKRLDPRWQRRYRRALARSRRNNLYLKSIGRCR